MHNLIDDNGVNRLKAARHGYYLYNKHDIYLGRSLDLYGEYCEREAELLRQICRSGDVVLEVGANIGTHTVWLAKHVGRNGRVYAFEPQRVVFQTLCGNLALNSITNTYAYQMAAGSRDGEIVVPHVNYSATGNFGGVSLNETGRGEQVPVVKVDTFVKSSSLRLMKIDVEGMEIEVLKGSRNSIMEHRPIIYLENDRRDKSQELIEYLWDLGYQLFWHLPRLFNPQNYYQRNKNVLGNLVSINMLCIPQPSATKVVDLVEIKDSTVHPSRQREGC